MWLISDLMFESSLLGREDLPFVICHLLFVIDRSRNDK
jgi:hypothetical protein